MSEGEVLRIERAGPDGEFALLTLNRPGVLNAIDNALLTALHAALDGLEVDPPRAVIVTGEGDRSFCTGMDLKERAGFDDDALRAQRGRIVGLIRRLYELQTATIAAVEGFALAGGFELALACDLIVASSAATFALPEVKVGIFPGGGSTRTLTWLVGPARARDVILTGRRLTADEAERWGIVARVVPPGEALAMSLELAATVAEGAPLGVRQAKAAIQGANLPLGDGLEMENALYEVVLTSADRREGFAAFAEKRRPRFQGR
jgi:enoyl-CoA hydratase/carnithine racemase